MTSRSIGKAKNLQSSEVRPRNILDSSAPEPRGKERLIPKEKKPKSFRKKINGEKVTLQTISDELQTIQTTCDSIGDEPNNLNPDLICQDEKNSQDNDRNSQNTRDIDDNLLNENFSALNIKSDLDNLIEIILHPPYYREYVDQALNNQIEYTTYTILINLIRFQDRIHHRNPEKLSIKRRYVCGFNQVNKLVRLNKAKAVIIAPDIQKIIKDGILDQTVKNMIFSCTEKEIPVIFTSTRSRLAKVCCKNPRSFISCIAILDYSGTHDDFHKLMEFISDAKKLYQTNRTHLISYLESLSESSIIETCNFIKDNNQIPENLQIFRETIYSPLQRNVYCYIKAIKQTRK